MCFRSFASADTPAAICFCRRGSLTHVKKHWRRLPDLLREKALWCLQGCPLNSRESFTMWRLPWETAKCFALFQRLLSLLMGNFMKPAIFIRGTGKWFLLILTVRKSLLAAMCFLRRRKWRALRWGARYARISGCPTGRRSPMLWPAQRFW